DRRAVRAVSRRCDGEERSVVMATNKSVLSLATFSFGLAIGFIFCYVLFSIVLQEREEAAPVRILCWVMTGPQNLDKKTKHVKATWAQRCNKVLYMSSEENKDFPTVGLDTKEGRDQLYWKTIKAFQYVHDHHLDEADWFMKADDDTYVVVDNLRWLLSKHNPDDPIYFGRRFKPY
ncbi:hypothetical protein AB205_0047800, partial [Aquarana catesbeiana]